MCRLNSNYCSDGERQLVIGESTEQTHHVSTHVQPTTIKYEIIIGASQKGGDGVSDGCGYTYRLTRLKSLEVHFSWLRSNSALLLHSQAS